MGPEIKSQPGNLKWVEHIGNPWSFKLIQELLGLISSARTRARVKMQGPIIPFVSGLGR